MGGIREVAAVIEVVGISQRIVGSPLLEIMCYYTVSQSVLSHVAGPLSLPIPRKCRVFFRRENRMHGHWRVPRRAAILEIAIVNTSADFSSALHFPSYVCRSPPCSCRT